MLTLNHPQTGTSPQKALPSCFRQTKVDFAYMQAFVFPLKSAVLIAGWLHWLWQELGSPEAAAAASPVWEEMLVQLMPVIFFLNKYVIYNIEQNME